MADEVKKPCIKVTFKYFCSKIGVRKDATSKSSLLMPGGVLAGEFDIVAQFYEIVSYSISCRIFTEVMIISINQLWYLKDTSVR